MPKTAYEKVKVWRENNHDKWLAIRRDYNIRQADTVRARRKRYNDKHREDKKRQRLERKLGISLFIDEHKASSGCVFCGENFPAALDFHHTGEKTASVSQMWVHSLSLARVKAEMDKCVLLCANCHRKLHAGFLSLE